MIKVSYIWTEDNMRLQGIHFVADKTDICVLIVHGMSGNFIENYFATVLGETLVSQGIGCMYGHNRGYNHINDILKKKSDNPVEYTTERHGATYERFVDSEKDISAWFNECQRIGYKKIILLGHSLGCNKVINYLSKYQSQLIVGVVLASPPDMVGLFEKPEYQPNHRELLEEARANVKEGNPRKLVSKMVWDWYNLSSQTYLDLSEEGGLVDNLPVLRNPDTFPELAKINVPILGIMGEYDDIAIRTLKDDMNLIAARAVGAPSFVKKFILGANHTYDQKEKQFANVVAEWVKALV